MEWIIFVDLGFIVFLIVMAAILAAVGTAGAVMWIWPAIKIIVGVLFAIVMVVGIYLYVKRVITSERSIFTKIYIFLLCAVNAIWSGVGSLLNRYLKYLQMVIYLVALLQLYLEFQLWVVYLG